MPRQYVPTGRPPQPPPPSEPGPKTETVQLGLRCLELLGQGVARDVLAERLHVTRKRVDYALKIVRKMGLTVPEPAEPAVAEEKPRRPHRAVHKRPSSAGLPADLKWQDGAACWGEPLELFFGPEGERAAARHKREEEAKAFCEACPVETECLEFSIGGAVPAATWQKQGVWGGLNEDDRAHERRKRMRAASEERREQEARVA